MSKNKYNEKHPDPTAGIALEKIIQYGKRHKIEIYGHMPPGYSVIPGASTAPVGSVWICNDKSRFNNERRKGLLLESWLWDQIKESEVPDE